MNLGHMNFPPGLNLQLHEISGTPSVGPAPDGYSSADTNERPPPRAQRLRSQIGQIVDSPSNRAAYLCQRRTRREPFTFTARRVVGYSCIPTATEGELETAHSRSGCI